MADLEWPKGLWPYKTMFYLQPHVGGQESPITRTRKVYGLSAPRWVCRLTFRAGHSFDRSDNGYLGPHISEPEHWAARLDALIAQLQGGLNCILLHDFRRPHPQAWSSSSPHDWTINAALAGAGMVVFNVRYGSLGPSIGDYIGGDGRPHIVTDVRPHAGSMLSWGSAESQIEVEFQPPLSRPIEQGAKVVYYQVTAPFRLISDDAGQNEGQVDQPIDYVLEFVEDLR